MRVCASDVRQMAGTDRPTVARPFLAHQSEPRARVQLYIFTNNIYIYTHEPPATESHARPESVISFVCLVRATARADLLLNLAANQITRPPERRRSATAQMPTHTQHYPSPWAVRPRRMNLISEPGPFCALCAMRIALNAKWNRLSAEQQKGYDTHLRVTTIHDVEIGLDWIALIRIRNSAGTESSARARAWVYSGVCVCLSLLH